MEKMITYGGKIFGYLISRGTSRIYKRGRQQVIVDEWGNVEPYRNVVRATRESK